MGLVVDVRRRIRGAIAPLLLFLAILYFGISFVEGNRGLLAWISLSQKNQHIMSKLNNLKIERKIQENLVRGLRMDSLDLDLLDEQSRKNLGFLRKNEYILRVYN
tara:strand:- start:314 stop:628 length:315 start_codon:yes stop_codon:yes gene_type:complete